MHIKELVDENFQDYKKPSMFIGTGRCDWKCCNEQGLPISICQNSAWGGKPEFWMEDEKIAQRYVQNPITSAIVIGGLEPLLQCTELLNLLKEIRKVTGDDIVIYTGYYKSECKEFLYSLKDCGLSNIVVKFGRYIMNDKPRFDEILGVTLASSNQYAEKVC